MTRYENPASTVDLIVASEEGILLIKRKGEPYKGYWALPGGYLNCGQESLEEAAVRELREETSLFTQPKFLQLTGVYSAPDRDPRGHVIAHTYAVLQYEGRVQANDDAADARMFKELPENLAFDHEQMIIDYLAQKQR